jgi:hypothetical protein
MGLLAAFLAAVTTAAVLFALEFIAEGFVAGLDYSISIFLFGVVLNLLVGIPAALLGGLPVWMILRTRRIQSPFMFGLAGAALAMITYLVMVAMGMGQPSDHPITFFQNLGRSFHIPRIAAVLLSGAAGAWVSGLSP